jgi:chromosomal replication initiation ATPase DnaA
MSPMTENVWTIILERLKATIDGEEYRRWFSSSSQASDSGDQITVWVPAQTDVRHIQVNYLERIYHELEQLERTNVTVRFVATGYEGDEDENFQE